MMRWRTPLIVVLNLFLVLPLAWALHIAMFGRLRPASVSKVAPMLSAEERRSLMTYERPCGGAKECQPPLACFVNGRTMWVYCTDSKCMTDQQCTEEMACRTVKTLGNGPAIRHCTLVGGQKEGDTCFEMPPSRDTACERELLCQGSRCGRPCRLDEPASCPEGFFCQEGLNGPSCVPTCEGRACPEGQECVRLDEGVSICAQVYGQNCQRTPCPDGQKCVVENPYNHPREVWGTCLIYCDEANPASCPEGFVCDIGACRKSCDPAVPNVCGPHYKCYRYSEKYAWTCDPDM
ncbi:hypothetical protein [Vitiosangium sp. GDMCC 1.1324]|uniref:hypothetical protein n=1 Tax=Vitiosangium sp. (strain GDMCC 1.1324) TaxID=2138576 RepID=UPI000D35B0A4|nr:hypothetical protein [Vitiosangium sp. GDMCC 1.1324]PTL81346.1 hypothetical protein DAT35_24865 [Vitiosangium sp. GDMCC 1.1324]